MMTPRPDRPVADDGPMATDVVTTGPVVTGLRPVLPLVPWLHGDGSEPWMPPEVRRWRPPPLGDCRAGPCQVRVVLDESGSVSSYSDPVRLRHPLIARVADALRRACTCRRCSVAVTTFDRRAVFDPAVVDRHTVKRLQAFLTGVPPTSSTLGTALRWAEQVAAAHGGPSVTAVLSDFELFDPDLARLYDRFAGLPGQSIGVVLRVPPPPSLTSRVAVVRVLPTADLTTIADGLAEALQRVRRAS